jgi:hypothetical protein
MNQQSNRKSRRLEIQRLSQTIASLSSQLNKLIIEEQQEEEDQQASRIQQQESEFNIGDRVEITNNYRGLRGTQGQITHVTTHQVSIQVDGQRRVINKKKNNVRKIDTSRQQEQE